MDNLTTKIRKANILEYGVPDEEEIVYFDKGRSFSIMIYYPVPDENNELFIITAGVTGHLKTNSKIRGEFILIADVSEDNSIKKSVNFVKLFVTHLIKKLPGTNNTIIFDNNRSFDKMFSIFLYRDTIYNGITINDEDIFINYYFLIPLYNSEASELKLIPDKVKNSFIEEIWQKRLTKINRPVLQIIPLAIGSVWDKIVEWHTKHQTRLSGELNTKNTIHSTNDKINELKIPEDLKYFIFNLNTSLSISDYQLLSSDQIYNNWKIMEDLAKTGKIRSWHSDWIPFAEDSGGNLTLVDATTQEQTIIYLENDIPHHTNVLGFFDWLLCYKNDLYSNKYEIDDEGFLFYK